MTITFTARKIGGVFSQENPKKSQHTTDVQNHVVVSDLMKILVICVKIYTARGMTLFLILCRIASQISLQFYLYIDGYNFQAVEVRTIIFLHSEMRIFLRRSPFGTIIRQCAHGRLVNSGYRAMSHIKQRVHSSIYWTIVHCRCSWQRSIVCTLIPHGILCATSEEKFLLGKHTFLLPHYNEKLGAHLYIIYTCVFFMRAVEKVLHHFLFHNYDYRNKYRRCRYCKKSCDTSVIFASCSQFCFLS